MLHERADRPQVELPREAGPRSLWGCQGAPSRPSPRPQSLPVDPRRRGLLLSPLRPGRVFLWLILSRPLSSLPQGSPRWRHTGSCGTWAQEAGSRGLSRVGAPRSVSCHGDTTGLAPGAAGFQEGALSLPPRGSATLAPRPFHPWPTKQGFGTDCLPGSEALVVNMQPGPCSQGAYNLWWRWRKTNKQDDLEHRCHEEMKPENRVERDAGAVLRGRDPEGLSEEVMLKCKGPRWEEARGCEEELGNQRGRGEGGRGRAGGNEVRKLGCTQSLQGLAGRSKNFTCIPSVLRFCCRV